MNLHNKPNLIFSNDVIFIFVCFRDGKVLKVMRKKRGKRRERKERRERKAL
jgi:hypothetical protein